jgi:hypothetical protein
MERGFNITVTVYIDTEKERDGQEIAIELIKKACREHPEVKDFEAEIIWVYTEDDEEGHEPSNYMP